MLGFSALSVTPLSDISGSTIVPANAAVLGRSIVTALGTRETNGAAAVLGKAIVTAYEGAIQGNAAITGRSVVTALGGYSREAVAAILGKATVTADGAKLVLGDASIVCVSTVSAAASNVVLGAGQFNVTTIVVANGGLDARGTASITGKAIVTTKGMIYGEEWTKQIPTGDTWLKQE
jgi:hypothetical protein